MVGYGSLEIITFLCFQKEGSRLSEVGKQYTGEHQNNNENKSLFHCF